MLCRIDLYFPNMLEWAQEFASSASCDAAADAATSAAFLMLPGSKGASVVPLRQNVLQISTWNLWSGIY